MAQTINPESGNVVPTCSDACGHGAQCPVAGPEAHRALVPTGPEREIIATIKRKARLARALGLHYLEAHHGDTRRA